MALDQEVIEIIVDAKTQEADKLRASLALVGQKVKDLKDDLNAGRISQASFESGFVALDRQIGKTQGKLSSLEQQIRDVGGGLQGATRQSAKFQVGLAAANTLQDVVQGGPASGINNILGLAGNNSARALGAEWLAAAGGIGAVAAGLATVAVVAGTAFLAIDHGLKQAQLDWSDFDEVLSNLTPIKATGEALSGVVEILTESGAIDAAQTLVSALFPIVEPLKIGAGLLDEYIVGWSSATEAARQHKAEVDRTIQSMREYIEAEKGLKGVQSSQQEESSKRGKLVADQVADLGGADGWKAVVDKLAEDATRTGGNDMVDVPVLDKEGKPTGKTRQVTRREKARQDITSDLYKATQGDKDAQGRVRDRLKGAGYDLKDFDAAAAGRDLDKEKKDAAREAEQARKKAESDAEQLRKKTEADAKHQAEKDARDLERQGDSLAKPLQDRFNLQRAAEKPTAPGTPGPKPPAEGHGRRSDQGGPSLSERRGVDAAPYPGSAGKPFDPKAIPRGPAKVQPPSSATATKIDRAAIERELRSGGLSAEDAAKYADQTLKSLEEGYAEAVRKRAGEKGISEDAAKADLIKEDADKRAAKAKQETDRAASEKDKAQRERVEKAEKLESGTGLSSRAENALLRESLRGGNQTQVNERVAQQLAKELQGKGMGEQDAIAAAREIIGKESGKLGDSIAEQAMQAKEVKAPERIGVGDFAASVEASGADTAKKQLDATMQMKDQLVELVRQGRGPARVG